eukprot:scaffold174051_cov57-Attheya_sp.AAC.2
MKSSKGEGRGRLSRLNRSPHSVEFISESKQIRIISLEGHKLPIHQKKLLSYFLFFPKEDVRTLRRCSWAGMIRGPSLDCDPTRTRPITILIDDPTTEAQLKGEADCHVASQQYLCEGVHRKFHKIVSHKNCIPTPIHQQLPQLPSIHHKSMRQLLFSHRSVLREGFPPPFGSPSSPPQPNFNPPSKPEHGHDSASSQTHARNFYIQRTRERVRERER